jgi:hypothetical protein
MGMGARFLKPHTGASGNTRKLQQQDSSLPNTQLPVSHFYICIEGLSVICKEMRPFDVCTGKFWITATQGCECAINRVLLKFLLEALAKKNQFLQRTLQELPLKELLVKSWHTRLDESSPCNFSYRVQAEKALRVEQNIPACFYCGEGSMNKTRP